MTEQERKIKDEFEKFYTAKYSSLFFRAKTKLQEASIPNNLASLYAEEVVQETFTALWKNAEEVMGKEYRMAWINQVLNNKITDVLRGEQWWKDVLLRIKGGVHEYCDSPFADSELLIFLRQTLSESEFQLICQVYLLREQPSDVCKRLGIKASALSMRLRRAKEKIKKYIINDGEK